MQSNKHNRKYSVLCFYSLISIFIFLNSHSALAARVLIPMDKSQQDHLKAYGLIWWGVSKGIKTEWLLNYRAGSFLVDDSGSFKNKAAVMGVTAIEISSSDAANIYAQIEAANMDAVALEKAPRVAIYTAPSAAPWDDAVTMALKYAEIPYDAIWDKEVLSGQLDNYDWLHLHHEDFSGQYSKFYSAYAHMRWYQEQVAQYNRMARELGFKSVSAQKRAVAQNIRQFVTKGGFLFAMCSATETIDIALASEGLDIVAPEIDGTPATPGFQEKLNYDNCLAFHNFALEGDPRVTAFSDIDYNQVNTARRIEASPFRLFEFSAKFDRTPTLLTQNHEKVIKGFFGLTTSYNKNVVKDSVIIMATEGEGQARYIMGAAGDGMFSFYGGHDPEIYAHAVVGQAPTNLALKKNSPGYRLILNNVLFPAAERQKKKT